MEKMEEELTPSIDVLKIAIKKYLPEEHWNFIDYTENDFAFKPDVPAMMMYGDIARFRADLLEFRRFPGNQVHFFENLFDPITTSQIIYKCQNNKDYIYKQELFKCLQDILMDCNEGRNREMLPILSHYLQYKARQLGAFQMIVYDHNGFDELVHSLEEELSKFTIVEEKFKLVNSHRDTLVKKFKEILPKIAGDESYSHISYFLEEYARKKPMNLEKQRPTKTKDFYERWLNIAEINIRVLEKFTKKHPEWFTPQRTGPAVVRLFRNFGDTHVVMVHELDKEMRRAVTKDGLGWGITALPALATWSLSEVETKVGAENFRKISFPLVGIRRTRHRAVYIPTIDEKYCITAIDAVRELIHDTISVKSLTQNITYDDSVKLIENIVSALNFITQKQTYFITLDTFNEAKKKLLELHQMNLEHVLSKEKLSLPTVSREGFDLPALNDQIQRLGLGQIFSLEILDHASMVMRSMILLERKWDLDTSDMYDALEVCQLMCIINRSQEIRDFFHEHEYCEVLLMECQNCLNEEAGNEEQPVDELVKRRASAAGFELC